MTSRNEVMTQSPGHVVRTDQNTLTVKGGYCVLDGVLYSFGGGPGQNLAVDIDNTQNYCISTPLAAGQECLYVVYLVASSNAAHANSRIRIAGGTPTTTASGVYPPTPDGQLVDPVVGYSEENGHSIVLAVVRGIFEPGGPGGNDNVNIVEVNDKRVFIRPSPNYILPLTNKLDATAAAVATVNRTYRNGVNYDVQLKDVMGAGHVESGDFGGAHGGNRIDVAALWVSHQNWKASIADASDPALPSSSDPNYGLGPGGGYDSTTATYADAQTPTDVLYFSSQGNAKQSLATGGAMTTVRVGSKGVDKFQLTVSGNKAWPVTSYGDQVFITDCTTAPAGSNFVTYTPTGEFPEGHMIWIQNTNGSHDNIRFNATGISNQIIEAGKTAQYVYDGTTWYRLMYA
tara:strand:- start:9295 stop:10497 length:1203 start_codon:yes stop_codon:yes gene_type:complete